MTLQSTSALFVTGIGYSATPRGPRLNLVLTPSPHSYIGSVSISRSTDPISGTVFPGTAARPGRALVSVDEVTFAHIYAQAILPCRITLSYDALTHEVLEVEILRGVATAAFELTSQLIEASHEAYPQVPSQDEAAAE